MTSKQLYFVLVGAICAMALALVGGAYGMNKVLQTQAKRLSDDRLHVSVLDDQQTQLDKAKTDVDKYQDLGNIVKSVVPQDKDQAQTVRQIVNIASNNGVPLSSISFPNSTLGTAKAKGTSSSLQLSQLTPVAGIKGMYTLQLTIQTTNSNPVDYSRFIPFLSGLEQNRHTALVTSIQLTPSTKNRSQLAFTLILNEYIKP